MADYARQARYRAELANPNVQRALASIRDAEDTARYDNPYGTAFGGVQFSDYSQHPGILGSFTDSSGRTRRTTAAGAYQMLGRTWNGISDELGLTDFSPESQDIAAVGLIDRRGALDDVHNGNVPGFAHRVRNEWASMPDSPYGQPTRSLARVQSAWDNYGTQNVPNTGILGAANEVNNTPLSETNPAAIGPVERGELSTPAEQFGPMTQTQTMAQQYGLYGLGQLATQKALAAAQPQTSYVDPQVTTDYRNVPPANVPAPAAHVPAPQQNLAAAPQAPQAAPPTTGLRSGLSGLFGDHPHVNNQIAGRGLVGGLLGSIAGGLLGGPIGAMAGGLLGKTVGTNTFHPDAPQAPANNGMSQGRAAPSGGMGGYGSLSAEGRSAYASSPQARSAVDSKSPGLW